MIETRIINKNLNKEIRLTKLIEPYHLFLYLLYNNFKLFNF
jgi:hypothetical protein